MELRRASDVNDTKKVYRYNSVFHDKLKEYTKNGVKEYDWVYKTADNSGLAEKFGNHYRLDISNMPQAEITEIQNKLRYTGVVDKAKVPWAIYVEGAWHHPTFLYESIWCFLLFLFLIWFSNHKRSFSGQLICLYFMLYSFERFFVESLRTDSLMIGPLRQAQVISIALFIIAFIFYRYFRKESSDK